MSHLWKLRDWLTVDEAAPQLSLTTRTSVREDDVLRLALNGHLTLSVNLPMGADVMCFEGEGAERPTLRKHIDGLWELPMIGVGRREVDRWFHRLRGLPAIYMDGRTGAIVERPGIRCQLPADPGNSGGRPRSALPEGSVIVVRTAVLAEFAAKIAAPLEKPLGERERATLLTIIAALAKEAKIDVSKPSTAGSAIEKLTQQLGATVPARTVAEHLGRIADALERRSDPSS